MTSYDLIRPDGTELTVEADGYSRNDDRELFLHNDTASHPIGNFPVGTAIIESERRVA